MNLTTHSLERNGRVVTLLFGFTSKIWFEEKASDQVSEKHQTDYKINQTKDKNCIFVVCLSGHVFPLLSANVSKFTDVFQNQKVTYLLSQ